MESGFGMKRPWVRHRCMLGCPVLVLLLLAPVYSNDDDDGDGLGRTVPTWRELAVEQFGSPGARPPKKVLQERCYAVMRQFVVLHPPYSENTANYYVYAATAWEEGATADSGPRLAECLRGVYEVYVRQDRIAMSPECEEMYAEIWSRLSLAWWKGCGSVLSGDEFLGVVHRAVLRDSMLPLTNAGLRAGIRKYKNRIFPGLYEYLIDHSNELRRDQHEPFSAWLSPLGDDPLPESTLLKMAEGESKRMRQTAVRCLARRYPNSGRGQELLVDMLKGTDRQETTIAMYLLLELLDRDLTIAQKDRLFGALHLHLQRVERDIEDGKWLVEGGMRKSLVGLLDYALSGLLRRRAGKPLYAKRRLAEVQSHIEWMEGYVGKQFDGSAVAARHRKALAALRTGEAPDDSSGNADAGSGRGVPVF